MPRAMERWVLPVPGLPIITIFCLLPVSYTHLDVYKRQNWNSGDSLYKSLPVTLDFAKVLSRMSKQNEVLFDKSYDFRYFM